MQKLPFQLLAVDEEVASRDGKGPHSVEPKRLNWNMNSYRTITSPEDDALNWRKF